MHITEDVKTRLPGVKLAAYWLSGTRYLTDSEYVQGMLDHVHKYLVETPEFFDSDVIKEYGVYASRSCGRESKVSLLARLLVEGAFPSNNAVVDLVNIMQVYEGVVASVYDSDKVVGEPRLSLAHGIGRFESGGAAFELSGREVILRDDVGALSLVPCYDASRVYITKDTKNLLLVVYGNSLTTRPQIVDVASSIVQKVMHIAGGRITGMIYLD